jgi:hypothetical protein
VVKEIVTAREALTWRRPLAISVVAEVGTSTMAMHAVSFSFVPKKAGGRGEWDRFAFGNLASEGLQMRIDVLTMSSLGHISL